jgi:type II secretory pathway pseudopilin PulG
MIRQFPSRQTHRQGEQGYVLLTLILIMALLAIATATAITSITFNIKRDREEEMIHRGAQYARAIRAYYKKFGRYPATIENLENTNQMRFLRKRYKDPITGKDFRLLHFGEAKLALSGMGGGVIPGANTLGSNGKLVNAANPDEGNSASGQNKKQSADSGDAATDAQNGDNAGSDSGDPGSGSQPGQSLGGLPIVGVASTSKITSIREFDKKKKYSDWQFVYDPTLDRGILISTPYQPMQQMFGMAPQNVNGATPTPGLGNGAPGVPTANPVSPTTPPAGNPNQPTDAPIQQ